MYEELVNTLGGVTLVGGGSVLTDDLAAALALAPQLIAADGGGDKALMLGHEPLVVIGDLDSLSVKARLHLTGRLHHVPAQDDTDFSKCLNRVRARFYLALGFTGQRVDHTLAAFSEIAARPHQAIIVIGEDEVIFRAPETIRLDLPIGERFSIFPFGPVTGRSEGLRWPIDGIDFSPAGRIGTSNEVTGPVRLDLAGPALLLVPKRNLGAVLRGLGVR